MIEDALAKRIHVTHHFFNRNVYAFSVGHNFDEAKRKLDVYTKAIAMGAAIA